MVVLIVVVKVNEVVLIFVGYVMKDGVIVGLCLLEYFVDVVLYFEGDCNGVLWMVCGVKN